MADINGRSLTWAFIIYPESMPENWLEILRDLHTLGAVSPLHENDINPDGTIKKAHYHVLLKFPTKKSAQQIYSIERKLGTNVFPEPVDNFDGYLRYLIHIDNPEKYQYELKDIIPLAGLDVESYFAPSKTRASTIIMEICEWLMDHPDVTEFDILYGFARGSKEWMYVLNNLPCYGIVRILNSRRYRNANKNKVEDDEKC